MNHRTKLLKGAIELAKRSEAATYQGRIQSNYDRALWWAKRSHLQQLGSIRLLRLAQNFGFSP